jgi:hypothetical protein
MDASTLIEICEAWAGLGSAVQEQVKDILDAGDEADCNPNAVKLAIDRLGRHDDEEAVQDIIAALKGWRSEGSNADEWSNE